jgi:hypothetical protein
MSPEWVKPLRLRHLICMSHFFLDTSMCVLSEADSSLMRPVVFENGEYSFLKKSTRYTPLIHTQ